MLQAAAASMIWTRAGTGARTLLVRVRDGHMCRRLLQVYHRHHEAVLRRFRRGFASRAVGRLSPALQAT